MVYAATLSEYQRLMGRRLIITEFWHIYGVYNIVSDRLSILLSASMDKYEPITGEYQCRMDKLL